ncbi:hypothetical protein [Streptomyces sp. NBC_00233]|uniref:hypothetical protein n=1 Tax=Streptomyces sp. NBC_00233 TaxID=2975686 RepID=UPI002252FABB|nr:hypothetical protein [Streptomyces sp. NBC_00233]MCX5233288.1 hypothetical protein [Streptomyces sp. NBC_00233]
MAVAVFLVAMNARTEPALPVDAAAPAASASINSNAPTPSEKPPASPSPLSSTTPTAAPVSTPVDYAGRTRGGGAALAVSVQDNKAVAYLCDGKRTEVWLSGTAGSDGSLNLTGPDGARLIAQRANGHASGTVHSARTTWTFDLPRTGTTALYQATGQAAGKRLRAGWVVLPDGSQTGIVTRSGKPFGPAPRLNAATGSVVVDGIILRATAVTGQSSLAAH